LKDVGDIDNAVINLRFANGGIGNIDLSRNAVYGYDIHTEVLGSEGSLLIGRLQQTAVLVMTRQGSRMTPCPISWNGLAKLTVPKYANLLTCITQGGEPSPSGLDARQATAIGIGRHTIAGRKPPVLVSEV